MLKATDPIFVCNDPVALAFACCCSGRFSSSCAQMMPFIEAPISEQNVSPVEAFTGQITRNRTGPLYQAGLLVVAVAMVLLPLIYIALVVLSGWAVLWHLTHNTWIFNGASGRGAVLRLIVYLGPAVAGVILVFFMIKPFFARKAKAPEPITLDPAKEPLLFAFVEKICGLVGAPVPCRIDIDCQVNASASLRRGLWSKDLVLTIGMPLASGLNMREFAGVLAHEFGHFAQGAGMRLTYIIRNVNFWFARVVYERDAWDVRLEESARGTDFRIGVVLHAARGCVWLTRRILWALMHAGHAISCFMLRQMEYDADSYEAKLAGSDSFESTASQLRVLNVAMQVAYEDVRQSWTSHRLPENLPLLIDHKASSLPADVHQKISASAESARTGWFDTHPCDADRNRAVRKLNEPGVFRLTEPAARLFSDFGALSKSVTRHQYEKHFELEFTEKNLMSAEEILRESAASAEAEKMVRQFFGDVNISIVPLLVNTELPSIADKDGAVARWRELKTMTATAQAAAEKASTAWGEQQERFAKMLTAHYLAKAGFKLEPQEFELPAYATSPHEQEIATRNAMEETAAVRVTHVTELASFISALGQRVKWALGLAQESESGLDNNDAKELTETVSLFVAVGAEMQQVHEMGAKLRAFALLAQNRGNHSDPSEVDRSISELAAQLESLVAGIQERLKDFIYPFPHARGVLTVTEYLRSEKSSDHEWQRTYLDSDAHVERLFALHYRLIGRILARAASAEAKIESVGAV
jgi:Zn-dependent protease with chaperone function